MALSQDIYNCDTAGSTANSENKDGSHDKNKKDNTPDLYQEYHVQLEVHGAPVYCTLITFPSIIYILSSDSCTDTKLAILHLHQNFGYFVDGDILLASCNDSHGQKVVDSFVAPILEITGKFDH